MTSVTRRLTIGFTAAALAATACRHAAPTPLYRKIPVERRDIVVTATASGVIQPILTLSVKSKASGEILEEPVQTGDEVRKGQLLARIDPRIPQNNLTQAQANVAVARAQLANATAQLKRSEALLLSQSITPAAFDSAQLASATAHAALATATATLQTARDAMQDTHVQAPNTGTVLELDAVLGTVISSPTNDVGGGTVILKMANLDTVQVSALVDETDVGKVQPGLQVTISVDAYPNRAFDGRVLKIEPQAQVSQNVTMFPVEVNILNPEHLLKPGMNTEVEIHIGQRQGALAVPNTALRRARDVASAASVFGLDPRAVERQLATRETADGQPSSGGGDTTTDGSKLHAAERAPQPPRRDSDSGAGAPRPAGAGADTSYIVFALRGGKIVPVAIRSGLTDQDYMEVTAGLTDRDTVLVPTSAPPR